MVHYVMHYVYMYIYIYIYIHIQQAPLSSDGQNFALPQNFVIVLTTYKNY